MGKHNPIGTTLFSDEFIYDELHFVPVLHPFFGKPRSAHSYKKQTRMNKKDEPCHGLSDGKHSGLGKEKFNLTHRPLRAVRGDGRKVEQVQVKTKLTIPSIYKNVAL